MCLESILNCPMPLSIALNWMCGYLTLTTATTWATIAWCALLHEARLRFLREHDFGEFNIAGLGLIVTDLVVSFKAESFVGEVLTFHLGLTDFNKYGCDFIYRVENQADERVVALAKIGIVFFDYDERKIARIPRVFLERCAPHHSGDADD